MVLGKNAVMKRNGFKYFELTEINQRDDSEQSYSEAG